jgi:hypothetical protein
MRYNRKVESVKAIKWDGNTLSREMYEFLGGKETGFVASIGDNFYTDHDMVTGGLMIITKDGTAKSCLIGSYVVLNDKNEYDVIGESVFEQQYEMENVA